MPIQTYKSDGITPIFDSATFGMGMCVGVLQIAAGIAMSKAYPSLVGCSLRVFHADGSSEVFNSTQSVVSVTYPSGVPTISVGAGHGAMTLVVWCLGSPTAIPTSGVYAVAPTANVSLTSDGVGLNYLGRAGVIGATASWGAPGYSGGSGAADGSLGFYTMYFDYPGDIVPVVRANDGEYVAIWGLWRETSTRWRMTVTRLLSAPSSTAWTDPQTPDVYVFGVPVSGDPLPGFGVWSAASPYPAAPAWDLTKSPLLKGHAMPATYSDSEVAAIPAASVIGVFGTSASGATEYVGDPPSDWGAEYYWAGRRFYSAMWRRVGNGISAPLVCTNSSAPEDTPVWQVGFVPALQTSQPIIVDLTGL